MKKTITIGYGHFFISLENLLGIVPEFFDYPLGALPIELGAIVNSYIIGANHYSFFMAHIDKRPTSQDLSDAKQNGF